MKIKVVINNKNIILEEELEQDIINIENIKIFFHKKIYLKFKLNYRNYDLIRNYENNQYPNINILYLDIKEKIYLECISNIILSENTNKNCILCGLPISNMPLCFSCNT